MSLEEQIQNQLSPAHAPDAAANAPASSAEMAGGPPAMQASPATPAKAAAEPVARNWIPVRTLTTRHRERILLHLLSLDGDDRHLRFGFPATDDQIARYVDGLDFDRDELFGVFNRKVELVAAAHLAYAPPPQTEGLPAMAEFGVSVMPKVRNRGFGGRLFDHAILHARNRGIETLFIHALSQNTAMLRIARKAGATVVRDGSETEAFLKLPPETIASRFDEVVGLHAAEIDYRFKWHANRVHNLLEALSDVGNPFTGKSNSANE